MRITKRALVWGALLLSSAVAGPAAAQVRTASTAKSGAVVESATDDPFGEVFDAAPPAAAQPTDPAEMEAMERDMSDMAKKAAPASAPPPAPPAPSLVAQPDAVDAAGLFLGPYLRLSGLVVKDPGFGLVAHFGALVRIEGGIEVAPFAGNRGLSFEAGLGAGFQAATSFETVESQLGVTSLQVAALYRVPVFTYLAGYAKVGGAVNFAHLRFAKGVFEKEVDQVKVAPSGSLVGGLELTIPVGYTPMGGGGKKANNWLGFFLEVGYELYGNLDFDHVRRDVDEDTDPARIPVLAQELGDLDLSGVTWRLGGSFRF
ncbi:MAG: hypothetical protein H6730_28710 [Deltaproteobacteria bacterium]|nr:hypothetical protein [Deltaproteobacteria bacterium]